MTDTFYDIRDCKLKKRRAIIYEAYEKSYLHTIGNSKLDIVNNEIPFNEAMKYFDSSCVFSITKKLICGVIEFTVNDDKKHFFGIYLKPEEFEKLVRWYNLKPMEL